MMLKDGMPHFPKYGANVKKVKPEDQWTLADMIKYISNPPEEDKQRFLDIRQADYNQNPVEKRRLKEHVFFVNPAVQTDGKGRGYKNITAFTGYMVLDFDKFDNAPAASDFKSSLFDNFEEIECAWLSVSSRGVRAIVRIPEVTTVDEYKSYFYGFRKELEIYNSADNFDMAPQNPVLPLFLSYDPQIMVRDAEIAWTRTAPHPDESHVSRPRIDFTDIPDDKMDLYEKWSKQNLIKAVNTIESDGHTQLRAACYAMGGRVGAGYISFYEAEHLAYQLIDANAYLAKGVSGYKKTATTMLLKGMEKPLLF